MFFNPSGRYFGSPRYGQLDPDGIVEDPLGKDVFCHFSSFKPPRYCYLVLSATFIALAGAAGYLVGTLNSRDRCGTEHLTDTATRVPIGTSMQIFQYNSSFAAPPPTEGGSEPVWDSMIPNGLGYIKDKATATDTSVISVFHQLHCLYTVRRAFYMRTREGTLEEFDLGRERKPHIAHCFDYLRQGLLCSADASIEPALDTVNGFLGAGFARQCRDFGELKDWAEKHRAFDAHGFLAEMEHG